MTTVPTRINRDLFDAAKSAGELHSRSAAQQLDHWARLGRELEASPAVTHDAIERALAGQMPYDALSGPEQAAVRVAWDGQITARISALDFEGRLRESGSPWPEANAGGDVVIRIPGE